ncbi:uncharacterized protein [Amphiura filiformis]|uniref:uncharacterized protein isoform X2 n=1 Tax=Amphiura filiformis TaxID=82378 RepID=UPI003B217E93
MSSRRVPPKLKARANTMPEENIMSRRREYKPMNSTPMAGNKETMSRIGRSAVKAACQTPEQLRVQRQRQLLQKIRQNLSEARTDTGATYETSDTLLKMQEELMKRMEAEGKMNQPGKSDEEIEDECTKSASETLVQMKEALSTKRQQQTAEQQRARLASAPAAPVESRHTLPSTSIQTERSLKATSGVHMAVAEVHAVQDADD